MALPVFISYDEKRDDRRLELSGKDGRSLWEGKDLVHEKNRYADLVPVLIGKEAKDMVLLHRARSGNHFVAARAGQVNMLTRHGAVIVDNSHQRIISLLLADG